MNAARNAASSGLNAVVSTIRELPGRVADLAGSLFSAGQDMVRGLINGLKSMVGAAADAAADLAKSTIKGITDHLKIGSPSRLTFGIGQFAGEGLVNGIMAMLDAARRAGDLLASASISPLLPQTAGAFSPAIPFPSAGTAVQATAAAPGGPGVLIQKIEVNVPNAG